MKLIKNGIVHMDWDADKFYESRSKGFIAAIHMYGQIPVCFQEKRAFVMITENNEIYEQRELEKALKEATAVDDFLENYDEFVELTNGAFVEQANVNFLGLSDADVEDMKARLKDLSPYWEEILVDMNA